MQITTAHQTNNGSAGLVTYLTVSMHGSKERLEPRMQYMALAEGAVNPIARDQATAVVKSSIHVPLLRLLLNQEIGVCRVR